MRVVGEEGFGCAGLGLGGGVLGEEGGGSGSRGCGGVGGVGGLAVFGWVSRPENC